MKFILKVLEGMVVGMLFAVLLVNMLVLGERVLLRQELPRLFGLSQAVVLSGSMEPTASAGDVILFRAKDEYQLGDVVIFRAGDVFITHRIVRLQDGGYVTRGDANELEDDGVLRAQDITGAAICRFPDVGVIVTFLKSPLGIGSAVLIALFIAEIPALIKGQKRKRVTA